MAKTELSDSSRSAFPTSGATAEATTWLRRFLALDSLVTTGNGLIYLVASGAVGRLLGVGSGLLLTIGILLTVFGAGVGYLGSRRRPAAPAVQAVIAVNGLWTVLSLVTVAFLLVDPSTVGLVWIPVQAAVVGGFAVLQFVTLRRTSRS